MTIYFFTQFFYPDIQATSQLSHELCVDMAKEHYVNVLCGPPLITADSDREDPPAPSTMRVTRLFSTTRTKKSSFDRILNHVSFLLSAFFYLSRSKPRNSPDGIFMFTSDNPLNVLVSVFFKGLPAVYICKDLYFEQGKAVGAFKGGLFSMALNILEGFSLKKADRIIVIGKRMRDHLVNERKVSAEKVRVINDWANTELIKPVEGVNLFSDVNGLSGKFVVMHSGRIGLTQDMELMLRTAKLLETHEDIIFVIIGEGVNKLKTQKLAASLNLKNVVFLPYQKRDALKFSLSAASAGVILSKDNLSHCLIPSRLYGIMASSRPVIATALEGSDLHDIIKDSGCGICIAPGDISGLKNAILKLRNDPKEAAALGKKGREFVSKEFSRSSMTGKYLELLDGLR